MPARDVSGRARRSCAAVLRPPRGRAGSTGVHVLLGRAGAVATGGRERSVGQRVERERVTRARQVADACRQPHAADVAQLGAPPGDRLHAARHVRLRKDPAELAVVRPRELVARAHEPTSAARPRGAPRAARTRRRRPGRAPRGRRGRPSRSSRPRSPGGPRRPDAPRTRGGRAGPSRDPAPRARSAAASRRWLAETSRTVTRWRGLPSRSSTTRPETRSRTRSPWRRRNVSSEVSSPRATRSACQASTRAGAPAARTGTARGRRASSSRS